MHGAWPKAHVDLAVDPDGTSLPACLHWSLLQSCLYSATQVTCLNPRLERVSLLCPQPLFLYMPLLCRACLAHSSTCAPSHIQLISYRVPPRPSTHLTTFRKPSLIPAQLIDGSCSGVPQLGSPAHVAQPCLTHSVLLPQATETSR